MDQDALGPVRAAHQRARLHIRAGRRRLRQGKVSAGIVTLYDALLHAMEYYMLSHPPDPGFPYREGAALARDREVYEYMIKTGVLDGRFDYEGFMALVERALEEEITGWSGGRIEELDPVMERLGVMPFDETTLPPEDPATY